MSRSVACWNRSPALVRRRQRRAHAVALTTWSLALFTGCGGSPSEPNTAAAPSHAAAESDVRLKNQDDESIARPTLSAPLCDDGTCSVCGGGFCPTGWYCDESARGGPACGWLPQCTKKPSCACLNRALGTDCACREREGGLYVTCK